MLEAAFYQRVLDRFVATGELPPELVAMHDEPLYGYLYDTMRDSAIRIAVLTDEVRARIFYDSMLRFVETVMSRYRYHLQRSRSEQNGMAEALEWSTDRRRDGWQALVQHVDEACGAWGFPSAFYRTELSRPDAPADDALWQHLIADWGGALAQKQRELHRSDVESGQADASQLMRHNLESIPPYLERGAVPTDEFLQAWGLMGGLWNTLEFERIRRIVSLQRRYPELIAVARVMGRTAADDSTDRTSAATGGVWRMDHSSRSDILGVTVGSDLTSLLPGELALSADAELDSLFVYKFLTHRLQTFRYRSEVLRPTHRLQSRRARRCGPMIVCLDTSGSMAGTPEQIAHSLIIRLLDVAERQHRDLLLIAFAVSARPIDVRRERARLLEFFTHTATGDTDATAMLSSTLALLTSSPRYMSADVLVVSDFKIPRTDADLMRHLDACRQAGTRFYGLRIGLDEGSPWPAAFDHIYQIGYTPSRRF